jgi:hypothetical protein
MADQLTELKALERSIARITLWGNLDEKLLRAWMIVSVPPLVPMPSWRGLKALPQGPAERRAAVVAMSL